MISFSFQNDSICQLNINLEVIQKFQIAFSGMGVGLEDCFLHLLSTKTITCHTYMQYTSIPCISEVMMVI